MGIHLALQGIGPGGWVSRSCRETLENGSKGQAGGLKPGSTAKQLGEGVDWCGEARI